MAKVTRIGFVSLFYPPAGGGAEIYLRRLIRMLDGFEQHLWTTRQTGEVAHMGDKLYSVYRFEHTPPVDYGTLGHWFGRERKALFESILNWAFSIDCDLLILNSPLTYFDATIHLIHELRQKCPVGTIVHDVPGESFSLLLDAYRDSADWCKALEVTHSERIRLATSCSAGLPASPFHLDTDFTLYNSAWVREFHDPDGARTNVIYHPPVKRTNAHPMLGLDPVDLTIVNPLPMKGGVLFLALANFYFRGRRMRILEGGYNNAMAQLGPFLRPVTSGFYSGQISPNIDIRGHTKNMSEVFRNTRLLLHPTRIEGYGMTAVEALLDDCLVVTTDIPGVFEGVGDAAVRMPYDAGPDQWADAVDVMIANRGLWLPRIRERAAYLRARQVEETGDLAAFLRRIAARCHDREHAPCKPQ